MWGTAPRRSAASERVGSAVSRFLGSAALQLATACALLAPSAALSLATCSSAFLLRWRQRPLFCPGLTRRRVFGWVQPGPVLSPKGRALAELLATPGAQEEVCRQPSGAFLRLVPFKNLERSTEV